MNSRINDIALDLGPFALDLEFECGKSNDRVSDNIHEVMCNNALGPLPALAPTEGKPQGAHALTVML